MTPLPREAVGDSNLVETVNRVIRCLRERQIIEDPTVELARTSEGTRIKVKGQQSGGGGKGNVPRWG